VEERRKGNKCEKGVMERKKRSKELILFISGSHNDTLNGLHYLGLDVRMTSCLERIWKNTVMV
jgi:hypothetical protein